MKTKGKCIGCHSIKLVNTLGLCKRCNRHAHDYISIEEMVRMKREREMILLSRATKKVKKAEDQKAEGETEEGTEEEPVGEEEPKKDEETSKEDKPQEDQGTAEKK